MVSSVRAVGIVCGDPSFHSQNFSSQATARYILNLERHLLNSSWRCPDFAVAMETMF